MHFISIVKISYLFILFYIYAFQHVKIIYYKILAKLRGLSTYRIRRFIIAYTQQ
jgi:hypothetical protein